MASRKNNEEINERNFNNTKSNHQGENWNDNRNDIRNDNRNDIRNDKRNDNQGDDDNQKKGIDHSHKTQVVTYLLCEEHLIRYQYGEKCPLCK